jgi:hypothetical protein
MCAGRHASMRAGTHVPDFVPELFGKRFDTHLRWRYAAFT